MKRKSVLKSLVSVGLAAALVLPMGSSALAAEGGELVKLRFFNDETWWPYTVWEGRIPEKIGEKTGVTFEVTTAADSTALNLMIASGDLGDLILTSDNAKISRLQNSDMCYTLDELAEMAGEESFDVHPVLRLVNTADDGNLYTIMCGYSPDYYMAEYPKAVYETTGLVVRDDIYDAIGAPQINNLDDFEAMLATVKEKYPDVVPFMYNCTHTNGIIKMLLGSDAAIGGFLDVDGHAKAFIEDPVLENYYELMNDWYLKGYMTDENFAFTSDSDDSDYMAAGKLFALAKYSNTADEMSDTLKEAGCDYGLVQLTDIIANQPGAKHLQTTAGWRGMFVPKSCADPVAAYNFMKFMYSEEGQCLSLWGEEGVDWDWDEEHSYPILNYDFEDPNKADGMKFWGWIYHDGVRNTLPGYGNAGQTFKAREAATSISETNPVLGMLRMGADSEEQTIMNNVVELYNNMTAQIITASTPEDSKALYQEMLETAKNMGVEKLDDWADSKYAANKAAYDEIKDIGADY
jgi:putative aldouronate transport system substrate-binding protein